MEYIWQIFIFFFVMILVYGGVTQWLGISPSFLIFVSVIIVGIVIMVRTTNQNDDEEINEKLDGLDSRLDDLEELIKNPNKKPMTNIEKIEVAISNQEIKKKKSKII